MDLFGGEPAAGPWRVEPVGAVLARARPGERQIMAVDGRSAGGKTTSAARLAAAVPGADAFWAEWEAGEAPFLSTGRPWARADLVVHGTPHLPHDPERALVVADPPGRMSG